MEWLQTYGLWGIPVALAFAPVGLPVPEYVSLLVAGVLLKNGSPPWLVVPLVTLGVWTGDAIAFTLGRQIDRVNRHPWGRKLVGAPLAKVRGYFERWGLWALAVCRLVPGMRSGSLIAVGALRIPIQGVLLFDAIASLVNATVWVGVGAAFSDRIVDILPWFPRLRNGFLVALAVVGLAMLARWLWRRHTEPSPAFSGSAADEAGHPRALGG